MRCVLFSAGWYFNAQISMNGTCYVADSLAPQREFEPGCHFYGPAAWEGGVGPGFGRELLLVRPDHWNTWFTKTEAQLFGEGEEQLESLRLWPAKLTVTPAGRKKGLGALDGASVGSEAELIVQVRLFAKKFADTKAQLYTADGRLQNVAGQLPALAT